ncbi:hypothetical protein [Nitrobacter sp.]|uniref:hypothetical protein n=1 Tax=Nitrobacter sp. TaxID=29420 RepID=UPI0029CAB791|nr:hypothetical protein [Nitrobacter sp.]
MNTAEELIRDAKIALSRMDDNLHAIEDYSGLICVLLEAPDLEEECPGLHRLMLVIREHLRSIGELHGNASSAIHRLANP